MEHQIHYTGAMNVRCQFCGALRFQRELNCCHNGKVSLPPLQEYPENLRLLFDADGAEGSNFRQNVRNYNSAFTFPSFGANIRPSPGRGPYCFRLQGQTLFKFICNLHADDPEERRYGQFYTLETDEAIHTRANSHENTNCLVSVFQKINEAMNNNPYAAAYLNMRAIEQQEQERAVIENMPARQVTMQFIPGPDRRRYNNSAGNEVAVIFVGDDGAPLIFRNTVVYPIGLQRHRIAYIS
ncbi:hypothetical protein FHG87_000374 [Trinorchestia longiramus]|nr:hypothetical protein FHG87_000374 [Trinorchestia longiramus]